MVTELRLHLLGGLQIECNGRPVNGIDSPRLRALLAYLVMHQNVPQLRQSLALRFWPDSSEAQALTNLRNLLFRLRQTLPAVDTYLYADHMSLQWQSGTGFWLDVDAFNRAVNTAQQANRAGQLEQCKEALQDAANLYTGELLPDCYDDWLIRERESLHQTFIANLAQLTAIMEDEEDFRNGVDYAQRLLQADTLNESAYRQLMRLYALAGNRAAALRVYQTCVTALELELGVTPDEQTRSEYERLLAVPSKPELAVFKRVELSAAVSLIGRQREWQTLHYAYQASLNHRPQFVLISGVAGIGKTRLAEEFIRMAQRQNVTVVAASCYAAQGDLPYAPLATWLRALPITKLEPMWERELIRLLPERGEQDATDLNATGINESWRRHRLFEAAAYAVLDSRPTLILFLDDIQWCDRDTLEWLHFLLTYVSDTALLVVATCRIEQQMDNDALEVLLSALERSDQRVDIHLGPLSEKDTFTLMDELATGPLDQHLAHEVYTGSEGNPLFIVEMMRMHLSKHPFPEEWRYTYLDHDIHTLPPKVYSVLESRLSMLSKPAREIANIAAVVGREFSYSLLTLICDCDEDILVQSLDELWNRRIIREHGEDAYIFSHDRIREVAYEDLSTAQRRMLHRRVALGLVNAYDSGESTAYTQTAMHFEEAGDVWAAIPYYRQAGDAAQRIFAYEQAVTYYEKALVLLHTLPESRDCRQLEADLLLALGGALVLSRGHSDTRVAEVYSQAWELCKSQRDSPYRFQALLGLRRYHFVRGEMGKACDLGTQLITEAETLKLPAMLARAHMMHCETLYRMGEFRQSLFNSSTGYDLYIPLERSPYLYHYGTDIGACCLVHGAFALQFLGYFDQAQSMAGAAIEWAEHIEHPFTLSMVHNFTAMLYCARRDMSATQHAIETARVIAEKHGFPLAITWASGLRAWVMCQRGNVIEGILELKQAIETCHVMGVNVQAVDQHRILCEAYIQTGDLFRASYVLDETFDLMQSTGDRCWEAELHRLRGVIDAHRRDFDAAERAYQRAIEVAQAQENRLMELRASVSLARVWLEQDRNGEVKSLLQAIYDWFTEGFDTPDMQDAAELLQAL